MMNTLIKQKINKGDLVMEKDTDVFGVVVEIDWSSEKPYGVLFEDVDYDYGLWQCDDTDITKLGLRKDEDLSEIETVTLTGYADSLLNETLSEMDIVNEVEFTVPKEWALKMINEQFPDMTYDEFINEYTWDSTDGWAIQAIEDKVLIGDIKLRGFEYALEFDYKGVGL